MIRQKAPPDRRTVISAEVCSIFCRFREDETVVFSWIEYPSKTVRDEVYRRMKDDPRMKDMDMPFDGKRMIYGGFQPIFDEKA